MSRNKGGARRYLQGLQALQKGFGFVFCEVAIGIRIRRRRRFATRLRLRVFGAAGTLPHLLGEFVLPHGKQSQVSGREARGRREG